MQSVVRTRKTLETIICWFSLFHCVWILLFWCFFFVHIEKSCNHNVMIQEWLWTESIQNKKTIVNNKYFLQNEFHTKWLYCSIIKINASRSTWKWKRQRRKPANTICVIIIFEIQRLDHHICIRLICLFFSTAYACKCLC